MKKKIRLCTLDVGSVSDSLDSFSTWLCNQLEAAIEERAEIVLFPEFTWLSVERETITDVAGWSRLSAQVWNEAIPALLNQFSNQKGFFVLGSAPYFDDETRTLHNRAVVVCDGKLLYQDKLNLTPWETGFLPGQGIVHFEWQGIHIGVTICLDVEIPDVAARLKTLGIELLLVPSATETRFGFERVNRCASARAVELCAFVAVSHLLGQSTNEMLSENVGGLQVYYPSQPAFSSVERSKIPELLTSGTHLLDVDLDFALLRNCRKQLEETNPYHCK